MKGLSLNGGGIRGIITTIALLPFEKETFDVIAGTSTGSIIGGLLSFGYKPSEINSLYNRLAHKVFKKSKWFPGVLTARYSIDNIKNELYKIVGDIELGDLETKLIVTAYDTVKGEPVIFKSYKEKFKKTKLLDVITASCAAPTYFGCYEWCGGCLVDGGVYANNPSAILVREFERENWSGKIINIGTGRTNETFKPKNWGIAQWLVWGKTPIISTFMDSSHDIIVEQCKGKFGFVSYDIEIPYIAMDDVSKMEELTMYGKKLKELIENDLKLLD
ncbi:MAG: patatin-like phospholipase family protein [Candidatus Dojkabacteria bacterium]|nr:patatin-like phospholipase family protein [Candidatus Dojkabacteria bacterium]